MRRERNNMRWHWLANMCLAHNLRHGAELGTKEGKLPGHLFRVGAVDSMFVVDLFENVPDNDGESYRDWNWPEIRAQYEANRSPFSGAWFTLEMSTAEAARLITPGSLDFVYIDADHSETGFAADLANWVPLIRPGGLVSGHDLNWRSIRNVLDREYPGKYKAAPNSSWYFWKPEA